MWICDVCNRPINNVSEGWLEWIAVRQPDGSMFGRDARIVHSGSGCQFDSDTEFRKDEGLISDNHLEYYLGPDGLMHLLSYIAMNEMPKDDVLQLIKRLHTPNYEETFRHFDRAIRNGIFEPDMPKDYYLQSDIDAVLEYLAEDSED